jgi:glycosyltransferase involved in cell wall biosynthesis
MRAIIVATSSTPRNIRDQIEKGLHHRIDYIALSDIEGISHIDYNSVGLSGLADSVEGKLRLNVRLAFEAARLIKEGSYDVVFSMSEMVGIPLCFMIDRGIRHVVLGHHLLSPRKLRIMKLFRVMERWDSILLTTRSEVACLRSEFPHLRDHFSLQLSLCDEIFYSPRGAVASSGDSDYILSLGLAKRDYRTLAAAVERLPHVTCHTSAASLWFKDSPNYGRRLPRNLHPLSYVPVHMVPDRYARSRFVVVSHISDTTHHSAGIATLMQAQAMGKAVITTEIPGMVDYVVHGETGLIVPAGNPAALADAIDYLWRNPQVANEMGRRGREWILANFSFDRWIAEIAALLEPQASALTPAGVSIPTHE